MSVVLDISEPRWAVALVVEFVRRHGVSVQLRWASEHWYMQLSDGTRLETAAATVCRHLYRQLPPRHQLYSDALDHWLSFSVRVEACTPQNWSRLVTEFNQTLQSRSFLVGETLSVADLVVWGSMYGRYGFPQALDGDASLVNVLRWSRLISVQEVTIAMFHSLPDSSVVGANVKPKGQQRKQASKLQQGNSSLASSQKEEGKFVDLPGAELGKVVVRFPPEASGYLHIGHAKAALLNQYYQQAFQGQLIMRFDDTNPEKESAEFEREILHDLRLLGVKPDRFTHSSDHFDTMLEMCERLMNAGKAYVDDTDPERMKIEREQMIESRRRTCSPQENMTLWRQMLDGSEAGQRCCVRAKINMKAANGCMRDPTIYRCKPEPHVRTGTKYKVYPTYDFCCPIVDSVEGVTHALRTTEYHDRDEQYYWFIDALALRRPYIYEYSRLNMTNTVLSKRKLTWFVENGLVDGWDDPRFPTVRGVMRRGMTIDGLKQFIIAQGSSRAVVFMEWDKIWAFNKKVIDPIAPRYTTVMKDYHAIVHVKSVGESSLTVAKHPKNQDVGSKTVHVGPRLLIDTVDVELLREGENATFINWGNLRVDRIRRGNDATTVEIDATPQLDNKDFKKTTKLTWLADCERVNLVPTVCVYYDHIINKAVLAKDEDFKQFIPTVTRREVAMLGDPELASVRRSEIIQIQRRGFFICDTAYSRGSLHSFSETPCVLIHIPDGHSKNPLPSFPSAAVTEGSSPVPSSSTSRVDVAALYTAVTAQCDKVRQMKAAKAAKAEVDAEVKVLLELKTSYKSASGIDYKPGCAPQTASVSSTPSQTASSDSLQSISGRITEQGNKVRQLKSSKADKAVVDSEVKLLLSLKNQFKSASGTDWKPGIACDQPTEAAEPPNDTVNSSKAASLNQAIIDQGDAVRELKAKRADKKVINDEVAKLLSLKSEFKSVIGSDWAPGLNLSGASVNGAVSDQSADVDRRIVEQGNKIRRMKSEKADKSSLDPEVKHLLSLKADYTRVTGKNWKPDISPGTESSTTTSTDIPTRADGVSSGVKSPELLLEAIETQGNKVRLLKSSKAAKSEIDTEVKALLALKQQYKQLTGADVPAPQRKPVSKKSQNPDSKACQTSSGAGSIATGQGSVAADGESSALKKQTRLGLEASKEDNLADWYSQIITKAELIEYYDVSGCYILRPWAFAMWDIIKDFFDKEIKKIGVSNCYFPMFVSKAALEKEKTHIADFSPEVAWVTKSGDSDLAEPIAIRPTSETVMYPTYARWIQSHRDLPLRLNQWNNVVRWEFKHPQPFLRTREFLWQEGHTAFATKEEADEEVLHILDLYRQIYEDLMAVPVIPGRKTEKEKFAGGDYTTTVEAYIEASGRAIQGATSHHLGQNFSRMFDIGFEDPDSPQRRLVFQNSWGITTRTIGVVVMVHGDNKGLVLPPQIAALQVVIVPCGLTASLPDDKRQRLLSTCQQLHERLTAVGVRCRADVRANYSPGWKFNHWELKGVPVRLEVGPRDLLASSAVLVRRDTGARSTHQLQQLEEHVLQLLNTVQAELLAGARDRLTQRMVFCNDFDVFCRRLDDGCLIQAPFCGLPECEDNIKKDSAREEAAEPGAPAMGAKGLCIPFKQPASLQSGQSCIHPRCTRNATCYTLFGRSY